MIRNTKRNLAGVIVVAVLFILWWGIPEYRIARADAMVNDLCSKDGGLRVYEVVKLPASRFNANGMVSFPDRGALPPMQSNRRPNDDFFYSEETRWLIPEKSFSPAVWRSQQQLFRAADNKLLGEAVSYSRRGGDPIGPWHQTSFGCPKDADITVLVAKVFGREE